MLDRIEQRVAPRLRLVVDRPLALPERRRSALPALVLVGCAFAAGGLALLGAL